MEIPITNPQLNASLSDDSKTDESITTTGTTVNVGPGGVIQQHCGNQKGEKEFTRIMSTILILIISFICDAFICVLLYSGQKSILGQFEKFERNSNITHERMERRYNEIVEKSDKTHREMMKQAKEGTIWLLRDDIIKTIDFHEATKTISQKQYRRLQDEYEYYVSIGGNHDVKDRYENFYAKVFGTQEVKMVSAYP